ncbi:MAG: mechanosensitive ion channel family protein [Pseudomonadota bacterium]|nr:mechanosensitive ion channel family protein [Pseudomonadota bacterium]
MSARSFLVALFATALLPAAPAHAQESAAELLGALKARVTASAPASEAPAANPRLVRQAAQATQKDDERILAEVTARLERNATFRAIRPSVQAGVATLDGTVPDNEARQLAAKVVGAVNGVVAVENNLGLAADFGARLRETWELLKDRAARGVAAIPLLITAFIVVLAMHWLGGWLARHLHVVRLDSHNPFLGTMIRRGVRATFLVIGLLIALDLLGATALVTAVLGSAGVVGIVLGFAFRDMAENYLSGILLSIKRPFEPRDHVRIDAHEGRVVSLSTRSTVLMTLDGNELRLPNATVFKAVVLNFTHNPRRRFNFSLVVGGGEDLQAAQDVGVTTLAAMTGVLADPGPSATVDTIVDSIATLSFFAWVDQRESDFGKVRSEAIRLVRQALAQACIEPPAPVQRVQLIGAAPAVDAPVAPAAPEAVDHAALARTQADVSPSTELDEQLSQERARKADQDMLRLPVGSRGE